MIAMSGEAFSERDFVKAHCLVKAADSVCPGKAQLLNDILLTRNTVAERINGISGDLKQ